MSAATPSATGPAPEPSGRRASAADASSKPSPFSRAGYAKALNRGYGDAMSRGFELALTLVAMVGIGWLVDRAFGTYPAFTIVLSVLGFVGISVKLWLGYDLEMRRHEAAGAWSDQGSGRSDTEAGQS